MPPSPHRDTVGGTLNCSRYIDLNPVRARLTDTPEQYAWSSYAYLCGQRDDPLLSPHPAYVKLSAAGADRAAAYRSLLREALPDENLQAIRDYLQQQRAWGRDDFRAMIQAKTQRFAGILPAHRPRSDTPTR